MSQHPHIIDRILYIIICSFGPFLSLFQAHREVARIKAARLKLEQNPARELVDEIADAVLGNIEVCVHSCFFQ